VGIFVSAEAENYLKSSGGRLTWRGGGENEVIENHKKAIKIDF